MRAPSLRVALAALAAAAAYAGGMWVTRDGPIGGRDGAKSTGTSTVTKSAPATSQASLATMSERLARLPDVAPGALLGVLHFRGDEGCAGQTVDLATMGWSSPPPGLCVAAGGRFGIRMSELEDEARRIRVRDLDGRVTEAVTPPEEWGLWGVARDGLIFCAGFGSGPARIRRFGGGSAPLPDCPIAQGPDGLLFPGPARASILDETGRRVVALREPLPVLPRIRVIGDRLIAVDGDLYVDGVLAVSYPDPRAIVLGASRDGGVMLVSIGGRLVVYRQGTAHVIDGSLATGAGAVAADGTRVLVAHDESLLVLLNAATLQPVARLRIDPAAALLDWRSSTGA
jgi:hypothetical protein